VPGLSALAAAVDSVHQIEPAAALVPVVSAAFVVLELVRGVAVQVFGFCAGATASAVTEVHPEIVVGVLLSPQSHCHPAAAVWQLLARNAGVLPDCIQQELDA